MRLTSDLGAGAIQAALAFSNLDLHLAESEEVQIPDSTIDEVTDLESLKVLRVGQRFFRRALLSAYSGECCISGLAAPDLLIASHIVPWRIDKVNRLNPSNGLLLSALHDKAFDRGIITIGEDQRVIVSNRRRSFSDEFFHASIQKFEGQELAQPSRFAPHKEFLAYHREHIFLR